MTAVTESALTLRGTRQLDWVPWWPRGLTAFDPRASVTSHTASLPHPPLAPRAADTNAGTRCTPCQVLRKVPEVDTQHRRGTWERAARCPVKPSREGGHLGANLLLFWKDRHRGLEPRFLPRSFGFLSPPVLGLLPALYQSGAQLPHPHCRQHGSLSSGLCPPTEGTCHSISLNSDVLAREDHSAPQCSPRIHTALWR